MDFDDLAQLSGGEYIEGGGGLQPSIVTARWGNALTNEMINIILAGGGTPDIDVHDQLLTNINNLIAAALAGLVDSSPAALDTLNELAQALGDDPNFAATITAALGGKANTAHTHSIANVTGLQTALDAKAPTAHTHSSNDITVPGLTDTVGTLLEYTYNQPVGPVLQVASLAIDTARTIGPTGSAAETIWSAINTAVAQGAKALRLKASIIGPSDAASGTAFVSLFAGSNAGTFSKSNVTRRLTVSKTLSGGAERLDMEGEFTVPVDGNGIFKVLWDALNGGVIVDLYLVGFLK
jgi:hypothetical protein